MTRQRLCNINGTDPAKDIYFLTRGDFFASG
jgi:hypothetical protein